MEEEEELNFDFDELDLTELEFYQPDDGWMSGSLDEGIYHLDLTCFE